MAFDKGAFRAMVKERLSVAMNPTHVADSGDAEASAAAAKAKILAVRDVAVHASAYYVSECGPELFGAAATPDGFDLDAAIKSAQDSIAMGTGESIADAAVILLEVAFLKLVKE